MSDIMTRAVYGGVYVAVLLCGVLFYAQLSYLVFGVMAALGLIEFNKLMTALDVGSSSKNYLSTGMIAYLIFALAGLHYISFVWVATLPLLLLVPFVSSLFNESKNALITGVVGVAGYIYVLLPLMLVHFLYMANGEGKILDFWPVLGMMILTWTSDTFAYLTGKYFGKTKLFERISPKKTWEGVLGGLLFSLAASYVIFLFNEHRSLLFWMVLGLVVPVFGIIGDLFESLIKRSAGEKDSGDLIPGHGGILDRIDAMLFTIPVTFSWIFIFEWIK
ncbi:MAG: phosphatidate cytidylyltransferase [Crocinitomicaceae bacterium]